MEYSLIVLMLVIFLAINIYIVHIQKKHIFIKQKMVDENKVKQYLHYLSSIIDNKNRELEELNTLKANSPKDKNLDLLIFQKTQVTEAISQELVNFAENNSDSLIALQTEKNVLLEENKELHEKIDNLNEILNSSTFVNNQPTNHFESMFNDLKKKYDLLLVDYEKVKKKVEELDREFTKIYEE